eukprot:683350-Pelagomonas_calceolata.AAC.3
MPKNGDSVNNRAHRLGLTYVESNSESRFLGRGESPTSDVAHTCEQVETAGDCYIVAGGVMSPTQSSNGFRCVAEDHDPAESAKQVMDFAKALLEAAKQVGMLYAVSEGTWKEFVALLYRPDL